MPTGLLFNAYENTTGPFGGGVVRIDSTDAPAFIGLIRDASDLLPSAAREALLANGAKERFYFSRDPRGIIRRGRSPRGIIRRGRSPRGIICRGRWGAAASPRPPFLAGHYVDRMYAGREDELPPTPPTPFAPFAVPAFELRRVLAMARAAGDPFFVTYTRLSSGLPTTAWRQHRGAAVTVRVRDDGRETCRAGGAPCAADELALLEAPPAWLAKVLMTYPRVLDDDDEKGACSS